MESHWPMQFKRPINALLPSPIEDTIDYSLNSQDSTMTGIAPVAKMDNRPFEKTLNTVGNGLLATPPVSPLVVTQNDSNSQEPQSQSVADPQLYPSPRNNSINTQAPLFPAPKPEAQANLRHDGASFAGSMGGERSLLPSPAPESRKRKATRPSVDDVSVWVDFIEKAGRGFQANVYDSFKKDPAGYLSQVLQDNAQVPRKRFRPKKVEPAPKPLPRTQAPVSITIKKAKRATPSATALAPKPKAQQPGALSIAAESKVNSLPKPLPSPKPSPKPKAAPADFDWRSIKDYCPPISTLSRPPFYDDERCMEVKWTSGNPFDDTNDPDRMELHPAEAHAARVLRLQCGQYLMCKKKIFEAKVAKLRLGQNFTKTHAQGACQIDVNKASKLFEAFNKVGWFDQEHFEKYM